MKRGCIQGSTEHTAATESAKGRDGSGTAFKGLEINMTEKRGRKNTRPEIRTMGTANPCIVWTLIGKDGKD